MVKRFTLILALSAVMPWGPQPVLAGSDEATVRLLQTSTCPQCNLTDVDLMHADLRDADLSQARLQRANFSQARLDGANLSGADLSFTSLRGASLRGADLRGSRLYGTDLRGADLSGAQLDPQALQQSHWNGAKGIVEGARSHAGLHNAGVDAALAGRWPAAETLFSAAIQSDPEEPLSWVARGLSRGEQGKTELAASDLAHAGRLFDQQGDAIKAEQLLQASKKVYTKPDQPGGQSANGMGSMLLSGAISAAQALAPIAIKALMPMIP